MRGLAFELRKDLGQRLAKLPLDGGFSCPHLESGGCLYCSESGSGEFTSSGTIREQLDYQKKRLSHKGERYIAYFQNFSGTYAPVDYLRRVYYEAIEDEDVWALAIATRVDCLGEEVLKLLTELNEKTYLWLELGLQNTNPQVMEAMNLGYSKDDYLKAMANLNKRNIKVVSHMIIGLPGASIEDELATARTILEAGSWGVKVHSLYVQESTGLAELYKRGDYEPLTFDDYIDRASQVLHLFGDQLVIHRMTGDPPRDQLLAPSWTLDKRRVLGTLQSRLAKMKKGELR